MNRRKLLFLGGVGILAAGAAVAVYAARQPSDKLRLEKETVRNLVPADTRPPPVSSPAPPPTPERPAPPTDAGPVRHTPPTNMPPPPPKH